METRSQPRRAGMHPRFGPSASLVVGLIALSCLAVASVEPSPVAAASGTVTVNVYEDFNANGVKDSEFGQTDVGLEGLTATVWCADGASIVGTTNAAGVATLSHSCPDPAAPLDPSASHVRIEVTWDPTLAPFAGLRPSHLGSGGNQPNGGTVQFVGSGAQTVNVAVVRPSDYVGTNAELVTPNYRSGTASNDAGGAASINKLAYSGGAASTLTTRADTGSVWGVAFSRTRGRVFSSAVVKRHTGLGPGGIDAIYSTPSGGGASTVIANVGGVGAIPDDATRGLGTTGTPSADAAVYPLVGKVGLGDLDLSDDETELWYTNLSDGQLYRLPIGPPPAVSVGTPVAVGMGTATCTNGQLRPWGVTYHGGRVYVGAVCDASGDAVVLGTTDSNLVAHVFVYDPVANTWAEALGPVGLGFDRGQVEIPFADTRLWYPWTSGAWTSVYPGLPTASTLTLPQPLLSDIEFDVNGVMVLGFLDRFGHQTGRINYDPNATGGNLYSGQAGGDVLRACWDFDTDAYVLESNGACGAVGASNHVTSAGVGSGQGPGGGEFYLRDDTAGVHQENGDGGLAIVPGSGTVAVSTMDVNDVLYTQGVSWFSQTDGTRPRTVTIDADTSGTSAFGKASGLGDLEVLANVAPTEVGNRIWHDLDGDGEQGPGEPGLAGVEVTLAITGGSSYTATTDSAGQYGFSSRAAGTGSGVTYNVPLGQGTTFDLSVPTTVSASGSTLALTAQNAGGGSAVDPVDAESRVAGSDRIDSDVSASTGVSASFTLGTNGANQHTFDMGYRDVGVNLGNQVWFDLDNDGVKDGSEQPVSGVTVELFWDGDDDGSLTTAGEQTVLQTATTDAAGQYLFTGLVSGGAYVVGIAPSNFVGSGPLVGYYSSLTSMGVSGVISETAAADPDVVVDDNDDNGTAQTSGFYRGGVLSATVLLTAGSEPVGEFPDNNPGGVPDGNSNLTIDFGFYRTAVGNQVWLDEGAGGGIVDNGLLDGGEPGLDGVVVRLFAADGATELNVGPDGWLGTTDDTPGGVTTVGGGYYQFHGLPAGSYLVEITAPEGYYSSTDPFDVGTPFAADSDDNGVGTLGRDISSVTFAMVPGSATDGNVATIADGTTANPRVDFGLVLNAVRVPPVNPPLGSMAKTGSEPGPLIAVGLALVIIGRLALFVRRRRPAISER